jgi:hypothetical protein
VAAVGSAERLKDRQWITDTLSVIRSIPIHPYLTVERELTHLLRLHDTVEAERRAKPLLVPIVWGVAAAVTAMVVVGITYDSLGGAAEGGWIVLATVSGGVAGFLLSRRRFATAATLKLRACRQSLDQAVAEVAASFPEVVAAVGSAERLKDRQWIADSLTAHGSTTQSSQDAKGERYCPGCSAQVSHDAEVCQSCRKTLFAPGRPSWLAGLLGYLWGGLIGGIALTIVNVVETLGGFHNRTLEMAVFGIVAVGAWNAKKAQLVLRRDLGVRKALVSRASPSARGGFDVSLRLQGDESHAAATAPMAGEAETTPTDKPDYRPPIGAVRFFLTLFGGIILGAAGFWALVGVVAPLLVPVTNSATPATEVESATSKDARVPTTAQAGEPSAQPEGDFDKRSFNAGMDNVSTEATAHALSLGVAAKNLDAYLFLVSVGAQFVKDENGVFNEKANKQAFTAAVLNITPALLGKAKPFTDETGEKQVRAVMFALLAACDSFVQQPGEFNTTAFNAAFQNLDMGKVKQAADLMSTRRDLALSYLLTTSGRFLDKTGAFNASLFNSRFDALRATQFTGTEEDREKTFLKLMRP